MWRVHIIITLHEELTRNSIAVSPQLPVSPVVERWRYEVLLRQQEKQHRGLFHELLVIALV